MSVERLCSRIYAAFHHCTATVSQQQHASICDTTQHICDQLAHSQSTQHKLSTQYDIPVSSIKATDAQEIPAMVSDNMQEIPAMARDNMQEIPDIAEDDTQGIPAMARDNMQEIPDIAKDESQEIPALIRDNMQEIPDIAEDESQEIPALIRDNKQEIPAMVHEDTQEIPAMARDNKQEIPAMVRDNEKEIPAMVHEDKQEISAMARDNTQEIATTVIDDTLKCDVPACVSVRDEKDRGVSSNDQTHCHMARAVPCVQGLGCDTAVVCELMVHPGYPAKPTLNAGGDGIGPDSFAQSPDRKHEIDVLTSLQMKHFYQSNEITLIKNL